MKKLILAVVALIGATGLAMAQELPEVIPPTPTVANLMQFEEVPVSQYTGQPNISIPLYSKAINADLGINIGLSYNTQGIKVNNRSGWTGTGWSLQAGGVISRTVRGVPDERKRNTGNNIGEGILHNDDFWNYNTLTGDSKQEFLWRANGTPLDKYDYQPDLFQFSVLGISGRFVLVKENGLVVPKLLSKNQNIRVEVDYNTNTSSNDYLALNSFTITDTKGYIYTFDIQEVVQSEPLVAVETFDQEQNLSGQGQQYVSTNAWYLSKIEMPNSTSGSPLVLATFDYQISNESYTTSVTRTESRPINYTASTWNDLMAVSYNASIVKPRKSHAYLSTTSNTKKLSRITFTRDSTYVKFDFNGTNHPETNGDQLGYLRILDKNDVENKHYQFTYSTSTANRLFLDEIDEVAGGNTQKYTLNYHSKNKLPAFDSPHDGWGYHTESLTPNANCGLSTPDATAILNGLLTDIAYPTGGVKEFVFERNTITYQGNTQLTDDQYRDLNPDNWLPTSLSLDFDSATENSAVPGVTPETFTISQAQTLRYKKNSTTATEEEQFNAYIEITGPNNFRDVFRLDEDEISFFLEAGTYEVRFYTLTIGTNYNFTGCIGYKNFKSTVERFVYGGGVRIKNIRFNNDVNAIKPEREISFTYNDAGGQNRSSGSIDGLLTGLRRTHTETVTRHFIPNECALNPTSLLSFDFEVTIDGLNVELTQGSYVGYKTVDVSEYGNGYTRSTFTSAQDHFSPAATFVYPYAPAKDIDYKRGLLTKQEVFDNTNRVLKETTNSYDFEEDTIAPMYKHYAMDSPWKQYYSYYNTYKNASYNSGVADNPMKQCYQGSTTGLPIIKKDSVFSKVRTKRYFLGVNYSVVVNSTSLPCDNDCIGFYSTSNVGTNEVPFNFISNNIKSTWAKLDSVQSKEYFYDVNGIQSIKENRQVFAYDGYNYQVKQQDSYYKINGAEEHLQTKYYYPQGTNLQSNSTTMINALIATNKVNEVLETQSFKNGNKISETHTIYDDFSSLLLPKEVRVGKGSSTPQTRIEFVNYDTYGNPIEVKKTNGTTISYIYGFNKSMPVAKLENVTYSAIESVLGTNFTLDENLSTAQETSLRASLPNAMITVVRYNPMVGVTSMTDPRGNSISYEYDEFNRLKFVKDKDGNLVSENQYHYKN
ncbi:RHS repeat domain-containing protein [Pseudotenacibaculum sp. MALMAid0570]|uniref:RHS repeat domain-containing protein n=1 Tax=Pseudotenacibaculum sp. MALMAid0570 TaxID=3143938 RepID=UPI0032DFC0CA